jgi:peptide/nickel transport system substrate-binding protein
MASEEGHASVRRVRISMFALLALVIVAALTAFAAVGCGGDGDEGGGTTDGGGTATGPVMGGTLRVGTTTASGQLDPATFAGNTSDIQYMMQVAEPLVRNVAGFELVPVLATEWSSEDGVTWEFKLREGVTFHNGEPFTADDVVYTFGRLTDEELGSPMVSVYANLEEVVAVDPTTVQFKLKTADSSFPGLLTSYRALMLSKSVADPTKELVGTGPFTLVSTDPEDRTIIKKYADYWGTDDEGNKLPYLDGIEFIYAPDQAASLQGLLGGQLDYVGALAEEQLNQVASAEGLQTVSVETNNTYTIAIRCDQGPGKDVKFRQALLAGTDLQSLIALVGPETMLTGNATQIGPAYGDVYLDEVPAVDVEGAKQLLADAGYADGAEITLYGTQAEPAPAMATAWQAQMEQIGVKVDVQMLPPDVFYSEDAGEKSWYEADFCIVDWGTRAVPVEYFNLTLVSDGIWNYSRWSNSEFDKIAAQIPQELDDTARADLYKQAQGMIQDEVPMLNLCVLKIGSGATDRLQGFEMVPAWSESPFTTAYLMAE